MNNLELDEQLLEYFLKLNLLITEFSFETDELIDALILAQRNVLHPVILNNNELKEHLDDIQKDLPPTQSLPIDIRHPDIINDFLKLTKTSTKYLKSQIIFIINFPVCNQEEYSLYRLWPMPLEVIQFQFLFIQPQTPYIAISNDSQKFICMNELDIINSYSLRFTKYYLLKNPIYLRSHPLCEIQLFDSVLTKLPKNCEVRHGYYNNIIFERLQINNSFLYWITNATQTTLVCPFTTSIHILQGAGILTIPVDCLLYTPIAILSSINEINRIVLKDFYPEFNLINASEVVDKIGFTTYRIF